MDSVPVIDFSAYSLDRESPDPEGFQKLIEEVYEALTTIGFMYLKNFGIPCQKISDAFSSSKEFFSLSLEEKLRCAMPEGGFHGYFHMEQEGLNPERRFKDLKEYYNFCPAAATNELFPERTVPGFRRSLSELFDQIVPLHNRVLEIIARGLKLEDPQYFVDRHKLMRTSESHTSLRTLFYPSLENVEVKEDQVRCGEHSDYGGITLLFQDSQPGLEVRTVHNKWIPAPPIEGTVVVNIGDILQMWSSDKLIASKHRVMIPASQINQERQSIAFFGNPDNDAVIECIDWSTKYSSITTIDYLNYKFDTTVKQKLNPKA